MWGHPVRSVLREARLLRRALGTVAGQQTPRCGVSGKKWIQPAGFDTGVKTFNSLTQQKEPLVVATEGIATW